MDPLSLEKSRSTSFVDLSEDLVRDPDYRHPIQRICSIMRRRGATWHLVHKNVQAEPYFEKMYPLVKDEADQIKKLAPTAKATVTQVTFFSDTDDREIKHLLKPAKKSAVKPKVKLLGSCVVMHIDSNNPGIKNRDFVFEAVIGLPTGKQTMPPASGISSHVHVFSEASFPVAGRQFRLDAAFYSQQNGVTTTCAHCCLKMALWHLRYGEYQIPTVRINEIAKASFVPTDESKEFDPRLGLQRDQIRAVCQRHQAELLMVHYPDETDKDGFKELEQLPTPYELAYSLVESGLPTLILFQSTKDQHYHMVPVIGHTLSVDEWFPHAIGHYHDFPTHMLHGRPRDYISSVEWAPHLIIHDDMMGPYYFVGSNILAAKPVLESNRDGVTTTVGRVRTIVAIVPEKSQKKHSPIFAQELASVFFWSLWPQMKAELRNGWKERLERRWDTTNNRHRRNLVLRTQILSVNDYIAHLQKAQDHQKNGSQLDDANESYLKTHLQRPDTDSIWRVEFTLPELFSGNLGKLGEILMPLEWADKNFALEQLSRTAGAPLQVQPLVMRLLGLLDLYKQGQPERARLHLGYGSNTPLFVRQPVSHP